MVLLHSLNRHLSPTSATTALTLPNHSRLAFPLLLHSISYATFVTSPLSRATSPNLHKRIKTKPPQPVAPRQAHRDPDFPNPVLSRTTLFCMGTPRVTRERISPLSLSPLTSHSVAERGRELLAAVCLRHRWWAPPAGRSARCASFRGFDLGSVGFASSLSDHSGRGRVRGESEHRTRVVSRDFWDLAFGRRFVAACGICEGCRV